MKTPLYENHVAEGARMVDFAGWSMPLHYGSQISEHHAVRKHAGRFDVSHMGVVDVTGRAAKDFLQRLLAGDVARLEDVGHAFYTLLLNDQGGIIDDLIVYRIDDGYRLVVNAATTQSDLKWVLAHCEDSDVLVLYREELCILAVQGPNAIDIVSAVTNLPGLAELKMFSAHIDGDLLVARTGYTGEDGVELICDAEYAKEIWSAIDSHDVQSAGLAARDSLRLEAGLNLYGHDMDSSVSPLVSNLAWTIHWEPTDRDFVGRDTLTKIRQTGVDAKLTGVVLEDKGVMREGCSVLTEWGEGVITSGSFSPTLGYSIGLARVPQPAKGACEVVIRNRNVAGRIVRPPFVRHGERVHK